MLGIEISQLLIVIISIALVICLVSISFSKSNLSKVFSLSALSSLVCLIYLLLDAPDVAMTEAAIGACLSTILLIIFVSKVGEDGHGVYSAKNLYRKIFAVFVCVFLIYVFASLEQLIPKIGDINNPINTGAGDYYIKNTESEIGIPAMVAAILASYRGFDTFGETIVILIAGIAVSAIFGLVGLSSSIIQSAPNLSSRTGEPASLDPGSSANILRSNPLYVIPAKAGIYLMQCFKKYLLDSCLRRNDIMNNSSSYKYKLDSTPPTNGAALNDTHSPINQLMTKFLLPYLLLFSLYVQVFGEIAPGGGFQAGSIFASLIIAYDLAAKNISISNNTFLRIASIGTLIYGITGLYSMFMGGNFLDYSFLGTSAPQALGIMLVEFGVGITVSSIMLFLYREFKS